MNTAYVLISVVNSVKSKQTKREHIIIGRFWLQVRAARMGQRYIRRPVCRAPGRHQRQHPATRGRIFVPVRPVPHLGRERRGGDGEM